MKFKSAVGAALLLCFLQSSEAATSNAVYATTGAFASEFGDTLPPIGYVQFCAINPVECARYTISEKLVGSLVKMTPDRWRLRRWRHTWLALT